MEDDCQDNVRECRSRKIEQRCNKKEWGKKSGIRKKLKVLVGRKNNYEKNDIVVSGKDKKSK